MARRKNPYNTKEFKALQREWYKKAADSGFRDIEHLGGKLSRYDGTYHNTAQIRNQLGGKERRVSREITVQTSENHRNTSWIDEAHEREAYYRALRHHVHKLDSAAPHLRDAFEAYSEGSNVAKICREISKEIKEFIDVHKKLALELAAFEDAANHDEED